MADGARAVPQAPGSGSGEGRSLMHRVVDRQEVQRLMRDGAQIVEVLPREEYEEEHLPGAINIPLKELDAKRASSLRMDRPVVVYCHDFQ
jgi:rhodanese-related sulfurtransferase